MRGEQFAYFVNGFRQRVTEFFILKMDAHFIHNVLPELLAAPFMNRFITNNREFVRPWRYENQHRIAFASLVHSETSKLFLCNDHRIRAQFAALNINANLARGF